MEITDITPQIKHRNFFNIFIDGKYSFAVSTELLIKQKLKSGQEISQEKIDEIIKAAEYGKWFDATLKFLSFRPHSQKEVAEYLKRKQVGEAVQNAVMEKLIKLKFLDDREFAKWFVEQRQAFRPKGKQLLKLELLQKGITKEVIEEVTNVSGEGTSEADSAWKAIGRKLPLWKSLKSYEKRRKISDYLMRRGFSWDTVKKIFRRVDIDDGYEKE